MAVRPAQLPVDAQRQWSTQTPAAFRNGGSVLGMLLGRRHTCVAALRLPASLGIFKKIPAGPANDE